MRRFLALLLLLCSASGAQEAPRPRWTVIHCGTLLADAREAPKAKQTLIVLNDEVMEVRDGFADPSEFEGARLVDLSQAFVLPGLIDCHTHITGEYSADVRLRRVEQSDADVAIQATVYARRTLLAGFTTIRNVGSSGDAAFALRDAISKGLVPGPRMLVAGESISPTGGHSDGTLGYREDLFDIPGAREGIGDGVAGCRKAVRAQVKRGANVIKLTATGGVLSATSAGTEAQFFPDELEAIVQTARQLGRKVAAHAHGPGGIKAALRAGVDSVEHGTFLDEESLELFKSTGAYLVPTLMAGRDVTLWAEIDGFFPPAVAAKARKVGPQLSNAFGRAVKAGVKVAFGTDVGVSKHGTNAQEFALMVQAGLKPQQALVAATVNAADLCGLSEQVGTLAPGKQADVIAVAGDPLEDVTELEEVIYVMRAGTEHKAP